MRKNIINLSSFFTFLTF
jgi:hypothetical protein